MWDSNRLEFLDQLVGDGFICIKGLWGRNRVACSIDNIYYPCSLVGKRALWEELRTLRASNQHDAWILAGDFNSVRCAAERKGRGVQTVNGEMEEFNEFIEDLDLIYLPWTGRKYTWHRANGTCMSRLDRFLISAGWANQWEELTQ